MNALASLLAHRAEWTSFCIDVGLPEQLRLDAFLCRGASLEPLALITAGVHGDEYEGPAAIGAVAAALAAKRVNGSVIAVPVVNPPAFGAAQRLSPLDGLNLARCFPGRADGTPTERLAYWFFEQFASYANYIIDLHSGGVDYQFAPVAGFYGPAVDGNPSFDAARRFGLEHLWKLPETGGVLSCEAWKRGGTAIGCEYLGRGQLSPAGSRAYAAGVLSCLAHWGIVDREHALPRGGRAFEGDWHLASTSGIFRAAKEPGSPVLPGDLIAEIIDMRGCVIQRFVSPFRGVLLGLRSKAYLREGDWGVLIGTSLGGEE